MELGYLCSNYKVKCHIHFVIGNPSCNKAFFLTHFNTNKLSCYPFNTYKSSLNDGYVWDPFVVKILLYLNNVLLGIVIFNMIDADKTCQVLVDNINMIREDSRSLYTFTSLVVACLNGLGTLAEKFPSICRCDLKDNFSLRQF